MHLISAGPQLSSDACTWHGPAAAREEAEKEEEAQAQRGYA